MRITKALLVAISRALAPAIVRALPLRSSRLGSRVPTASTPLVKTLPTAVKDTRSAAVKPAGRLLDSQRS